MLGLEPLKPQGAMANALDTPGEVKFQAAAAFCMLLMSRSGLSGSSTLHTAHDMFVVAGLHRRKPVAGGGGTLADQAVVAPAASKAITMRAHIPSQWTSSVQLSTIHG